MYTKLRMLLLLVITMNVACSESEFSGSSAKKDGSLVLEISPATTTLNVGSAQKFTATALLAGGRKKVVTAESKWSVSGESLADINQKGNLNALAVGDVIVTAVYLDVAATATVKITDFTLAKINIIPEEETINVGDLLSYKAIGIYSDDSEKDITAEVDWSNNQPAAAAFGTEEDSLNVIKALAVAETVVVTAKKDNIEGTGDLHIKDAKITALAITPKEISVPVQTVVEYAASATYDDGSVRDVTDNTVWISANAAIAAFSTNAGQEHSAESIAIGSTQIEGSYAGLKDTATLNVTGITLVSVAVTPVTDTVLVNGKKQYKAVATFSDNSTLDVTNQSVWTSSDSNIALISNAVGSSGQATGKVKGSTKIVATFNNVVSNEATLTVNDLTQFLLTAEKVGTGTGTVVSNPAGINCGATCSASYVSGTNVTLTATATGTSIFSGWSGACAGTTATCVVNVNAAKKATATFTKILDPKCTLTSTYAFYDELFDRKVGVVFGYSGTVTTAKIGALNVTTSGATHQVSAPTGTVQGTVTGPAGTNTCSLPVVVTRPTATFVSGSIQNFAQSNGTIGNSTLNFKLTNKDARLEVVSVVAKTLSTDFKVSSSTKGANTAVSGGKYEQAFAALIKFKYTPANIVQYTGQVFELNLKDTVTNATFKIQVPLTLRICRQEYVATCSTGTPTLTIDGTAAHPNSVGSL